MTDAFLAELFSSKVRAAVLSYMLPRPHVACSLTDLSRVSTLPVSSVQHECYKLQRIGLLTGKRSGSSYYYRLDEACPVHRQLRALVIAAMGEAAALRATLEDVPGLEAAFLARGLPDESDLAAGPAPLVLIGEIPLEEIDAAQERAAAVLGARPGAIEAVFYRPDDWRERLTQRSAYAVWLVSGPRIDLIGQPADEAVPA